MTTFSTQQPSEMATRLAAKIVAGADHNAIRWHGPDAMGQWCWQYREINEIAAMIDVEFNSIRRDMLETLHLAYRHLLDEMPLPNGSPRPQEERRLTVDEQRELGRRLAEYWGIKSL